MEMASAKRFPVLVVIALIVTACGPSVAPSLQAPSSTPASAIYQTISVDAFADILTNQSDSYTVVNVHIPYEGEVVETDMHIPYSDLDGLTSALTDKNAPIILYCRSGRMSEEASRALVELGYTRVWDVLGGMNAWTASGRELLNNRPAEQQNN